MAWQVPMNLLNLSNSWKLWNLWEKSTNLLLVHRRSKQKIIKFILFIIFSVMWCCLVSPMNYIQIHGQLPQFSSLVRTCWMAATWSRLGTHVFIFTEPQNFSGILSEMGQILQISVLILIFMALQGMQLLSGLGGSQGNAATSWWDGDVALVLGKEGCIASIFLQFPLPFLSPLRLASFVRLRCQLKVVPVVQTI